MSPETDTSRDPVPDLALARRHFLEALEHLEAGRLADAEAGFESALTEAPGRPSALLNLGIVRVRLGRMAQAIEPLDALLAQEPDQAMGRFYRALAQAELGRLEPALADVGHALAQAPDLGEAWGLQGRLLRDQGRPAEAMAALERAIGLGHEPDVNRYILAGLRGEAAPAGAPAAYVQGLFDTYAGQFDHHLVEVLGYQAPQQLLDPLAARGTRFGRALDLGCGTGLCGPLMRPWVAHLAGVDLSAGMLARARERGCYDALDQADALEFLRAPQAPWDLVVAADVFIYLGALTPVFSALAGVLRPGGLFCLSLEDSGGPDLLLRPSLRYAHSEPSLRAVAHAQGFEVVRCERRPLRREVVHASDAVTGLFAWLERR